jgi:iron complex outermembrane receptor protein
MFLTSILSEAPRSFRAVVVQTALLATVANVAGPTAAAQAQTATAARVFSIEAQPVSSALIEFSSVTGIDVLFNGALPADVRTAGVRGEFSSSVALGRLLSGTGFSYRFSDADTVTIIAPQTSQTNGISADGSTVLETITVSGETAGAYSAEVSTIGTRTDTPLRDIPQSIQVVKRSVLEDQQANSLTQALENVSNVRQSSTAGNRAETFITRGFASNSYAIDGSLLNATGSRPETNLDLANVERVEVLKGPASVLYGRGQPGGLINIVTRRPTQTLTADTTTQFGSYGFRRTEASVSGPLNEDASLTGRLTGAAQRERGFIDERADSERQFIGGVLEWSPDEDTRVSLSVDHTHQDQPYDRGLIVKPNGEINFPRDRFLGEEWSKVDARKTRVALTAEHQALDWLKFRGTLRYDDAYTHDTGIDFEGLRPDGRTLERRYTDRTEDMQNLDFQLETIMTFDTGNIGHVVLAGVQHVHSEMDFRRARATIAPIDIYNPVYGAPMPLATRGRLEYVQDIITTSVYLQDQIEFNDQWKMLAGLRYDYFDQKMDLRVGDGEPSMSDGALTGRIGLVYQPIEAVSLYANYATSFMPQSGMGEGNTALAPEEGWQIETGVKADLIPDRLSATVSVFQITKTNVAVEAASGGYSVLTGEQRSRGFELDLAGEVTDGWQFIASLGYIDAEITRDDVFEVGNSLIGVPHWSGSLWTTYEFQTGHLEGLKLGAGVTTVGARFGNLSNSFSVDGYYRLDASVSYKISDNLEFSLLARNLTDRVYIESTASDTENHPGAPFSVMAAIKATF